MHTHNDILLLHSTSTPSLSHIVRRQKDSLAQNLTAHKQQQQRQY